MNGQRGRVEDNEMGCPKQEKLEASPKLNSQFY